MRGVLITAAVIVSTAPASAQLGNAAADLAGRVPGNPASCLELDRVDGPIIEGPNAVLYRQSGARVWRMTPADRCPTLRRYAHLVYFNVGRRLCVGDRFKVVPPDSTIASADCRIGGLTPYDKVR